MGTIRTVTVDSTQSQEVMPIQGEMITRQDARVFITQNGMMTTDNLDYS